MHESLVLAKPRPTPPSPKVRGFARTFGEGGSNGGFGILWPCLPG
jgi:hypothetical protein